MESRRSLKGAIFESSLELKCLFFFGLAIAVVITMSFWLYWMVTEAQIFAQNPQTARLLVEQRILFDHWKAFQKKPRSSERTGFSGTMGGDLDDFQDDFISSMELTSDEIREEDFESRILRPETFRKPDADDRPRNAFEQELLEGFMRVIDPEKEEEQQRDYVDQIDEDGKYQYYQPIRAEEVCMGCHTALHGDLIPGDLIGVVHVTIPKPPARDAIRDYWALLLGVAIITAFSALFAFYVVIRLVIIRPLRHIRGVSDQISRGDISQRVDLHTGDEFESLGIAFNRMLRHLVATQDQLRKTNKQLDGKVDELAQLNMQLYETNRIKSDFMATMSHELRTPLNSILGFSDVLGSISSLDDKQKRYVNNINKSGRTLLNMINDILDMAKLESGRSVVQPTSFRIDRLIAAQCDMARPLADRKNIDLVTDLLEDLPKIWQDESRIGQIINNLLSNAIKFTPEGGRIKVEVRKFTLPAAVSDDNGAPSSLRGQEILQMKCIDTGVGITEEDMKVIFEKFRQGTSSAPDGDAMKREHSGSGLGLSIVKELCKLLNGEITVESELGVGSTFTVRLPWHLEPKQKIESSMMTDIEEFSKAQILGSFKSAGQTPPTGES